MLQVKKMKIAIIGKYFTDSFANHIDETLQDMGHTTVKIDPEIKFLQSEFLSQQIRSFTKTLYQQVFYKIPFIRNKNSKKIYNYYRTNKIDFTIVVHDFLTKQEIDEIKKISSSPIVLWFPDAISNFQKSMFFVAGYDYLFFVDKYIVEKLNEEFHLNTHYLPQCFNPKKHEKVALTDETDLNKYSCEITNAGNLYPSRAALYKHLTKYNFKMWGAPPAVWLSVPELDKIIMNKTVFNIEKSKAFNGAKVVLNNLHPAVINGVNKRTFEICGVGGFQITSYRNAVVELFEIGKEIVTYSNLEELIQKLDYYLAHDDEREQIREAGYQRALKEHTYEHRLNSMLSTVFSK